MPVNSALGVVTGAERGTAHLLADHALGGHCQPPLAVHLKYKRRKGRRPGASAESKPDLPNTGRVSEPD